MLITYYISHVVNLPGLVWKAIEFLLQMLTVQLDDNNHFSVLMSVTLFHSFTIILYQLN